MDNYKKLYWKRNLTYLSILLAIWFAVSFVAEFYWQNFSTSFIWLVFPLVFGLHSKARSMFSLP